MESNFRETPDTAHGRLLESVHYFGYSAERACSELKYLLQEDRWKSVGGGFDDINDFMKTISLRQFKLPIEERKEISKMLSDLQASQRKTAEMIGVSVGTVNKDVQGVQNETIEKDNSIYGEELENDIVQNRTPTQEDQQPPEQSEQKQAFSSDPADVYKKTEEEVKKEQKKKDRQKQIEEVKQKIETEEIEKPTGLFDVIVIDPPWNYGRAYDPQSSRVANPYPEMTQDQLLELEPPFKKESIIFLWTTHAFMWNAKELLDKWGFAYKATIVWDKEKMGMGAWFRMQCEFCLVGIKGKPTWNNTKYRDIIREPRREHSRKPDAFYEMIENVTIGRRLDYFSREDRDGWFSWGAESGKTER